MERPILDKGLDDVVFLNFYYLKEELVLFCRKENIQTTGSKEELTKRIALYLKTGEKSTSKRMGKKKVLVKALSLEDKIEADFVCSEVHRAFFKEQIGKTFSFNVLFQKWLRANGGKTYGDSVLAYYEILEDKKAHRTTIDGQFEYNTYIRDFFEDNKDKHLKDAIRCWRYKKSQMGHNRYEKIDVSILK